MFILLFLNVKHRITKITEVCLLYAEIFVEMALNANKSLIGVVMTKVNCNLLVTHLYYAW